MRVVIDSNALRTEELRLWLSASHKNLAILTDYAWMEIFKGDERTSLLESLRILRHFPKQVKILKGTKRIGTLDARAPGMADAMIQKGKSAQFIETVKDLADVENRRPSAMSMIKEHGRVAKGHFAKIGNVKPDLESFLSASTSIYGPTGVKAMRKNSPLGDATGQFFHAVDYMYTSFVRRHPLKPKIMIGTSRVNSFLWRYALASNLWTKRLISQGANLPKANAKITNDLSDLIFAVYGTYFNGVLSFDTRLNDTFWELEVVLRKLGARVPKNYQDDPDWINFLASVD